mgnify:CR=1 FL=1
MSTGSCWRCRAPIARPFARTPPPQWVRVVGGFTEHQFTEKRLPTLAEINALAPDTPVFLLHLYDRALLNGAALRAAGYTKDTPAPPGGEIVRDGQGEPTGLLLAQPNAAILYATLAKGPKLPFEYQLNSTRHFMRELNRLGVTGAIDAGGGYQNYPEDYQVIEQLAAGLRQPASKKMARMMRIVEFERMDELPHHPVEIRDSVRFTKGNAAIFCPNASRCAA